MRGADVDVGISFQSQHAHGLAITTGSEGGIALIMIAAVLAILPLVGTNFDPRDRRHLALAKLGRKRKVNASEQQRGYS